MAQFSTNESVSLEKAVDITKSAIETKFEEIDNVYDLEKCVKWITEHQFKKVCLQFPDYLLPDSYQIASRMQKRLGQVVYIMGDSAYESCCVDYITAQHASADAIIHFGPRCLSTWTNVIPCLCIYEKDSIDLGLLSTLFAQKFSTDENEQISVVLDTGYMHKQTEITSIFDGYDNVIVYNIEQDRFSMDTILYIGQNNRKLLNFKLKHRPKSFYYFDPAVENPIITNYSENEAIFKRRRFLIEKVKDSETIGIIIGTVVIENFKKAIDRIAKLFKLHRKKYYIISVGRPTVAKLANFPEMDVYVLICCSMSEIFESRDFHKPIVTVFDVEMALNPRLSNLDFSYELNSDYLNEEIDEEGIINQPDVSLLTGNLRYHEDIDEESAVDDKSKQIAVKNEGTIVLSDKSGAGYLAKRTFKGLEQNLGQTEVKKAEDGKKGIAAHYENELF